MAAQLMNMKQAQDAVRAIVGSSGIIPVEKLGEIEAIATGAMNQEDFKALLSDAGNEPSTWRRESDIDCNYVDCRQLDDEQLAKLEEWGLPPATANVIQPTINAILGLEAQTRTDWKVEFDDDASEQVAVALGARLNDEERKTQADRAISDAYASQIKAGIGWVEVNRESNPFAPSKYRVNSVHRREMWFDWRTQRPNRRDGRFLLRRKWYDKDYLKLIFPHMADIIEASIGNGWGSLDQLLADGVGGAYALDRFMSAQQAERDLALDEELWRDTGRKRAVLFECWYRVFRRSAVFFVGDTPIRFDAKDPRHLALVQAGKAQPEIRVFPEMRLAIWLGPHRVYDMPSQLPHQDDPYTAFWGYRADADGAPFGCVRPMRYPQDEINVRLSKMMSLLTSKRVMAEADSLEPSLMTVEEFEEEVNRHNAILWFKKDAVRDKRVVIEDNGDLSAYQFNLYKEAKVLIAEVSGIYSAFLGQNSNASSGVAIDSLVQQTQTTQAEISDNYQFGRRDVGEKLLSHIKADMASETEVRVGEGKYRRGIRLNYLEVGPDGETYRLQNAVAFAKVRVTLSDQPSTPSYRESVFKAVSEAVKSMPPEMQRVMAPRLLELSSLPDRKAAARELRALLGLPDPEAAAAGMQEDPATQAVRQQYDAQVQELAAQIQQLQQENQQLAAEVQSKQADQAIKATEAQAKARAAEASAAAAAQAAQADLIEAAGNAEKARSEGKAALIEASTTAGMATGALPRAPEPEERYEQPEAPDQPAIDPAQLAAQVAAIIAPSVQQALLPLATAVAQMQGRMQAPPPAPAPAPTIQLSDSTGAAIAEAMKPVAEAMQKAADAIASAEKSEKERKPPKRTITLPESVGGGTITIN